MDTHMSAAIVAFQGLTVCLYWIMVPRKRKWDNRKTYMVAVMLYLLWWAFCLPTIIQNDSMGKALEEHDFWNVVKLIGGIGIEVATSWIVSADSAHNRLLVAGVNVFLLVGFEVVGDIITYCLMSGEIWNPMHHITLDRHCFPCFFCWARLFLRCIGIAWKNRCGAKLSCFPYCSAVVSAFSCIAYGI